MTTATQGGAVVNNGLDTDQVLIWKEPSAGKIPDPEYHAGRQWGPFSTHMPVCSKQVGPRCISYRGYSICANLSTQTAEAVAQLMLRAWSEWWTVPAVAEALDSAFTNVPEVLELSGKLAKWPLQGEWPLWRDALDFAHAAEHHTKQVESYPSWLKF